MDKEVLELMSKRWGIVGFSSNNIDKIMNGIEEQCGKQILKKVRSKTCCYTKFDDGTTLRWVPARESSRGFKFGKMWCDKNINKEILHCVILHSYFGRLEDIIWI